LGLTLSPYGKNKKLWYFDHTRAGSAPLRGRTSKPLRGFATAAASVLCAETMKIYEDSDIKMKFEELLSHIEGASDLQYLQVLGGSLSVAIFMRLDQLKGGAAKSRNRDEEIEKLEKVQSLLTFKINSSTASEIEASITNAYKEYCLQ
jgi:hypothetical protein